MEIKTRVAVFAAVGAPGGAQHRIAYRDHDGRWLNTYGELLRERDSKDFESFARGVIDAAKLGIVDARLVLESTPAPKPRLCPVCKDGACETKSERCGK
jgi:hypothetical protein